MSLSLDELPAEVGRWRAALASWPASPAAGGGPRAALEALAALERRLAEGPAAPLRVAFFGPTGAGKSKLFNSLLGEVLSPSGYIRPFTRAAVGAIAGEAEPAAPVLEGLEAGGLKRHRRGELAGLLLVDTPDFDSVEDPNLEVAERIWRLSDLIVFTVDVFKYADASAWRWIERLREERRPCVFILNKLRDSAPLADYRARLETAFGGNGLPGPLVGVALLPLPDAALLPRDEPGLAELAAELGRLRAARPGLRQAAFRVDLERIEREWQSLAAERGARQRQRQALEARLEESCERAGARLSGGLERKLDANLKAELYQSLLRQIERIDILRYPRQLLALPVQSLKRLAGTWWPGRGAKPEPAPAAAVDRSCLAVESAVLDLHDAMAAALAAEPLLAPRLAAEGGRGIGLSHSELRALYAAGDAELRRWASEEAQQLAARLSGAHKVKFFASQVLFNSVVLAVQLKTFGVFSFAELLTDSVVSPLFAKGVGMALSHEEVKAFESAARARHLELLRGILAEARQRYAAAIAGLAPDEEARLAETLAVELAALRAAAPSLEAEYARRAARDLAAAGGGEG